MKKSLIFAIIFVVLVIAVSQLRGEDVIEDVTKYKHIKTMEVKNEQGQLSDNVFLLDDTAYWTAWGGIGTHDAQNFWKDLIILKKRGVKNLWVYLNSPGGSAYDGLSFADMIKEANKYFNVTVEATGLVASAAIVILVAGEHRVARSNTIFMVHLGRIMKFFSEETIKDLEAQRRMMNLVAEMYNGVIKERTKLTLKEISAYCEKETWFSAKQAKEWGFIDEIK